LNRRGDGRPVGFGGILVVNQWAGEYRRSSQNSNRNGEFFHSGFFFLPICPAAKA